MLEVMCKHPESFFYSNKTENLLEVKLKITIKVFLLLLCLPTETEIGHYLNSDELALSLPSGASVIGKNLAGSCPLVFCSPGKGNFES